MAIKGLARVMWVGTAALALSATACSGVVQKAYFSEPYAELAAEPVPVAKRPLAREVHWRYDSNGPDFHVGETSGPPAPIAAPTEASRSHRTRLSKSPARGEPLGNDDFMRDNPMAIPIIHADVQELIEWSLLDTGYVGPDAAEGSALFIELISAQKKADGFRGMEGVQGARVVLVQGEHSLASWRAFEVRGYRREPRVTPDGFVDPDLITRPPEHADVTFWTFSLMLRSAAADLEREMAKPLRRASD